MTNVALNKELYAALQATVRFMGAFKVEQLSGDDALILFNAKVALAQARGN